MIYNVIQDAEETLIEFNGWKDGYTHGAKLSEEPYLLVRVAVLLGDYLELLKQPTTPASKGDSEVSEDRGEDGL